jgi:hypothetical protein
MGAAYDPKSLADRIQYGLDLTARNPGFLGDALDAQRSAASENARDETGIIRAASDQRHTAR